MKILFACGGTAGHINPALSIADLLKRKVPGASVVFVGTPGGMENRLVKEAGYKIRHVPVEGLRRSLSPRNIRAGIALLRSFGVARRILFEEAPDLVIGTGGYVCYPVLRVASGVGIGTVLHESNARAGVAARMLARHIDLALVNFPSAKADFKSAEKTVVSGNPLRHGFYTLTKAEARLKLRLPSDALLLVVFGGSLGAAKLNETVESAVPRLLSLYPNLSILHAVGQNPGCGGIIRSFGRYERRAYISDMPTCLWAADAAVCRAGAMTVSEIAAAEVPSILIPYPKATGDHQTKNAKALSDDGAAILLRESDLTSDALIEKLAPILSDGETQRKMRAALSRFRAPDCETVILNEILSLCPKIDSRS
ncbi:MAG: undecaprenyldiphospho-muramoylpentapeptide beta-N-acetylglucosaminyltransferase [Clostridia bacterium]|nr:undecaprenyldiphospho-muramoylpentapeptide beta-N-acetylglucosaminyltransferase [Clostridia bacterium]